MTKKTCTKDTQDIERNFLRALTGGPSWDLVNGDLVFKGPGGSMTLARSL
jgi:heat shock protein HslJ